MDIPVNLLFWCAAIAPIVLLLVLMVFRQWSASKAAPFAMLFTMLLALFLYKSTPEQIATESLKGIWNALVILLVVWPAILIYEITQEAHAFEAFRNGVERLSRHKLLQIMALGWVFPSFLQGITGFGVAVAIGAPLLTGIGVTPLWAVVIVLLCHSWGGTFGTLALAWQSLLTQTSLQGGEAVSAAVWAAAFIWLYNLLGGLSLCWIYGKTRGIKEGLPLVLLISVIQGGGELLLVRIDYMLACFLPACVSLAAILIVSRRKRYNKAWELEDSAIMVPAEEKTHISSKLNFNQGFFPYYVLTAVTMICLMIAPVKAFLEQWQIGFAFPQMTTGYGFTTKAINLFSPLSPLTYPGTFLIIASLSGFLFYKKLNCIQSGGAGRIWKRTIRKTIPSTIAVASFIIMSKVMSSSGMISELSQGIVMVFGNYYVAIAPFVGMLGAFITSSNMSSNILFSQFQLTTAQNLGTNVAAVLGAQSAGGAVGTAICPGNIILGTSTVGISGKEGKILKIILPVVIPFVLLCGVLLFVILMI